MWKREPTVPLVKAKLECKEIKGKNFYIKSLHTHTHCFLGGVEDF